MNPFKVGDEVICVDTWAGFLNSDPLNYPVKGTRYIVTSVNEYYIGFKLPNHSYDSCRDGSEPAWSHIRFKCTYLIDFKDNLNILMDSK